MTTGDFEVGDQVVYVDPSPRAKNGMKHLIGATGAVKMLHPTASSGCTVQVKFFVDEWVADQIDHHLHTPADGPPYVEIFCRPQSLQYLEDYDDEE